VISSIKALDKPGFIADVPDLSLADGGWTDSRNVKYRDGAAEKCQGYTQALGELSLTAIWTAPITDGSNYFWVYGSNTVMYATDGSTHTNITGAVTLGATDDLNYSGGQFHGYMVVNDGFNLPQSWTPGLGNDLVSLTAWPALTTARVMRPFKDFMFGFRVTQNGSFNPRLMIWSDRAPQGSLPLSWDYQDPTNQAGINELGQTQDSLVDGLPLRDSLMIYKENHSWIADYIGGGDIFSFRQVFSNVGLLSERCAIAFGGQHLVWTDQDIVLHDGNAARSIIDGRARRWLFNRININRYKRCFAVADFRERTAYFCFPETGADWPNMRLAWNWSEDTLHVEEFGGQKTWAEIGIVSQTSVDFNSDTGTFDSASGAFDDESYSPFSGYMLITDAAAKKAYQGNTGETYNGVPMSVYAQRSGFPIKRNLIEMQRIRRLYPKVLGNVGDVLRFYFGFRTTQNASVEWSGPYNFTIGVDYKIDLRRTGRLIDFRVEYSGSNSFRLMALDIEHESNGLR
jgi:hypothetical protein